ncbi:hypothetical protein [Desulfuromonas thiophila]|uniref:hypothetical protein n=1 Tax=Desulfuromonas thiophila TaxID=57664 RepID=UPI0024A81734|nr:hypothetical protein [Desulfuromonas thiophila]
MLGTKIHCRVDTRIQHYSREGYNPYAQYINFSSQTEHNLGSLLCGKIDLEQFLRCTPQRANWDEAHIQKSHVLLVTCEPGISRANLLYQDYRTWRTAFDVAQAQYNSMISWLALISHQNLGDINGEPGWKAGGRWERRYIAQSLCGKVGYFLLTSEAKSLAGRKFLHIDAAPFPQKNQYDFNPLNNGQFARENHEANISVVERFCSYGNSDGQRYLFVAADRLAIKSDNGNDIIFCSAQSSWNYADRLLDLIQAAQTNPDPPIIRAITSWFKHGQTTLRNVLS